MSGGLEELIERGLQYQQREVSRRHGDDAYRVHDQAMLEVLRAVVLNLCRVDEYKQLSQLDLEDTRVLAYIGGLVATTWPVCAYGDAGAPGGAAVRPVVCRVCRRLV